MEARIVYLTWLLLFGNIDIAAPKASEKIIGGHPVDIKRQPFMLSLHNSQGFVCGASILSPKWAITALHCVNSDEVFNYYVRAGSNKPFQGGSLHRLVKKHAYNDSTFTYWFTSMLYHDIALFKVRPRFRFSNCVRPVRLPSEFSTAPGKLHVSGWGYNDFRCNTGISNVLLSVSVRYTPHEVCIKETPEYKTLVNEEYHICYGTRGRDSCYGDSGGPLASRNTIYGIVSFGQNCAVVSGIYEKVSYYRRWIKRVTKL